MSNEGMFYELCKIMANMEDAINTFESIGFVVEPDGNDSKNVSTNLYNTCSIAYRVASELLEFPSVQIENDICNELMQATMETVDSVSREIWSKYGIKNSI